MVPPGGVRLWQSYLAVFSYVLYTRTMVYEVLWTVTYKFHLSHLGMT